MKATANYPYLMRFVSRYYANKFCVLFSLLSANKYLPNRETNVIFAQYNPPTPTLIISPGS